VALFGDPVAQSSIWAAHNPADLVEGLRGTMLFVSCGNGQVGLLDPPGTDPSGLLVQLEAALLLHNQEFVARAAGAICVLMIILLAMNSVAIWLRNRYEQKW